MDSSDNIWPTQDMRVAPWMASIPTIVVTSELDDELASLPVNADTVKSALTDGRGLDVDVSLCYPSQPTFILSQSPWIANPCDFLLEEEELSPTLTSPGLTDASSIESSSPRSPLLTLTESSNVEVGWLKDDLLGRLDPVYSQDPWGPPSVYDSTPLPRTEDEQPDVELLDWIKPECISRELSPSPLSESEGYYSEPTPNSKRSTKRKRRRTSSPDSTNRKKMRTGRDQSPRAASSSTTHTTRVSSSDSGPGPSNPPISHTSSMYFPQSNRLLDGPNPAKRAIAERRRTRSISPIAGRDVAPYVRQYRHSHSRSVGDVFNSNVPPSILHPHSPSTAARFKLRTATFADDRDEPPVRRRSSSLAYGTTSLPFSSMRTSIRADKEDKESSDEAMDSPPTERRRSLSVSSDESSISSMIPRRAAYSHVRADSTSAIPSSSWTPSMLKHSGWEASRPRSHSGVSEDGARRSIHDARRLSYPYPAPSHLQGGIKFPTSQLARSTHSSDAPGPPSTRDSCMSLPSQYSYPYRAMSSAATSSSMRAREEALRAVSMSHPVHPRTRLVEFTPRGPSIGDLPTICPQTLEPPPIQHDVHPRWETMPDEEPESDSSISDRYDDDNESEYSLQDDDEWDEYRPLPTSNSPPKSRYPAHPSIAPPSGPRYIDGPPPDADLASVRRGPLTLKQWKPPKPKTGGARKLVAEKTQTIKIPMASAALQGPSAAASSSSYSHSRSNSASTTSVPRPRAPHGRPPSEDESAAMSSAKGAVVKGVGMVKTGYRTVGSKNIDLASERRRKGAKKFQCQFEDCGKMFTTNQNRQIHQWKHTGEKPYRCGCGYGSASRSDLRRHLGRTSRSTQCEELEVDQEYLALLAATPEEGGSDA